MSHFINLRPPKNLKVTQGLNYGLTLKGKNGLQWSGQVVSTYLSEWGLYLCLIWSRHQSIYRGVIGHP